MEEYHPFCIQSIEFHYPAHTITTHKPFLIPQLQLHLQLQHQQSVIHWFRGVGLSGAADAIELANLDRLMPVVVGGWTFEWQRMVGWLVGWGGKCKYDLHVGVTFVQTRSQPTTHTREIERERDRETSSLLNLWSCGRMKIDECGLVFFPGENSFPTVLSIYLPGWGCISFAVWKSRSSCTLLVRNLPRLAGASNRCAALAEGRTRKFSVLRLGMRDSWNLNSKVRWLFIQMKSE